MAPVASPPAPPGPTRRPERGAGGVLGDWREAAACRDVGTDIFFGCTGSNADTARTYCARCEVREECLIEALEAGITDGVWGGLDERERRKLQRR